ncbi:Uma2 family endonuclease [Thermoanaerobacterium butyriciformans]|uniref:Uma2 family endonuclease n=1 Tax=Thermoanaerobacterium butyriciformans TaxID=1702242 RepID=A0ABS4NCP2_9THEO|nr:Uma2 family endonuclease [Thermoanaerobacterium butyriciformans]MBP2071429.1 Uma2 family endonuclease [Thermoanaerobacterium butyriciformans]HHV75188.1 Uma2 family endonuclease [Thermoanaerobacterium sp.]
MELPDKKEVYTYDDYLNWTDDQRIELIDGQIYLMAPPSTMHQRILREIFTVFSVYLKGKKCEAFCAPFGVKFTEKSEKDIKTVVEPDIVVICDKSKLDNDGCKGAPDLIVEITSPSTVRRDRVEKFNLYEKYGVKEYWIVEPDLKIVNVFALQENNRYGRPEIYTEEDKIKVSIFDDLSIDLKDVFS